MSFSLHPFTTIFINCYVLLYCAVPKAWVSVSVHPARRSAAGITRDAGHHSRLCKVVCCSPALHALLALRTVPVGTSCAGTIDPGSKECASHTSE